jgi:hypothetical protein
VAGRDEFGPGRRSVAAATPIDEEYTVTTAASTTLPATRPAGHRRPAVVAGWLVTGLVAAFLTFDAVIHLLNVPAAREGSLRLGFDPGLAPFMGSVEVVFLALYLYRRTSVLGAVLLSTYLGGAFTAQLRVDAPLFSTLLFPVYTALFVWAGLWLRDRAVRAILPLWRD